MKKYLTPFIATDAGVIKKNKITNNLEILFIKRKNEPFQGKLAFPGGFVEYNEVLFLFLINKK